MISRPIRLEWVWEMYTAQNHKALVGFTSCAGLTSDPSKKILHNIRICKITEFTDCCDTQSWSNIGYVRDVDPGGGLEQLKGVTT